MTTTLQVQERLIALGRNPGPADGKDGPKTREAIKGFQRDNGLSADGIVGPKTLAVLFATDKPVNDRLFYVGAALKLSATDFARLASKHGIEEAKIRAVNDVEAAGKGFTPSGALVCLYEPHIAWKYTNGDVRVTLEREGLAYPKWQAGKYPETSYARIDRCAEIAGAEVACLATSWGIGQIMGFNYKACGFDTALEMVESFAQSEANQLQGMIRFISSNRKMRDALQRGDWATFASLYNGPAYKQNKYDTRLAAAYARHKKAAA